MERKVTIYALIDPFTLKVRYIGRTVVSLPMRLSQHVFSARHNTRRTHKESWIRSLLKKNSRPYIRGLAVVQGWKESYEFESKLIGKYKDRLVNHDDRGLGSLRNHSNSTKEKISESLREYFKTNKNPAAKHVYVYRLDGSYCCEYDSLRKAAKSLGIYWKTISKHLNGVIPPAEAPTKDGRARIRRAGYQFSTAKVERMFDFTRKK